MVQVDLKRESESLPIKKSAMLNVVREGGTENLLTVQLWIAEQRRHVTVHME